MSGTVQANMLLNLVAKTAKFLAEHPDKATALVTWLTEQSDTTEEDELRKLIAELCT